MIYTSYFASKKYDVDKAVCIARWSPSSFNNMLHCPDLYPPADLLKDWKENKITEEEYTRRYKRDVLAKLNPNTIYNALDGKVLLCYEKSGSFCHRNIVREWLNFFGYKCEEL